MISRKDGWLSASVGDELVMMSANSGEYIGLNEVGARIWALIETPKSTPELCEALATEFETTPDGCRAEVEAFLTELETHAAISREG